MEDTTKVCIPEYSLKDTTVQTCSIYANDKYIARVYTYESKAKVVHSIDVYKKSAKPINNFSQILNDVNEETLLQYVKNHSLTHLDFNEDDFYGSVSYHSNRKNLSPYSFKPNSKIKNSIEGLRKALTSLYYYGHNKDIEELCAPYVLVETVDPIKQIAYSRNVIFNISTNIYPSENGPIDFEIKFASDLNRVNWTEFRIDKILKNDYVIDKETGRPTFTRVKNVVHICTCDPDTLIQNQKEFLAKDHKDGSGYELYDITSPHSNNSKWAWIADEPEFTVSCSKEEFAKFKYIISSLLENFELQGTSEYECDFWPDIIRTANMHYDKKEG